MLRFFRKIRLKLVKENKTAQYFKYAIGEIVLVVIGILIALQINNWNQGRINDKALKEYLEKIKYHTQEDLRRLHALKAFRSDVRDQCKLARISILDKTEEDNLALFMSCGIAFVDYYFKFNSEGYESLKNSNFYGKINNTHLDSLLTVYNILVDEIAQNEKSYNEYILSQETYLSTQFDRSLIFAFSFLPPDSLQKRATPENEYYEDFAEYTATASYRNVISLAAYQFDLMINQYDNLANAGESVIKEIDRLTED